MPRPPVRGVGGYGMSGGSGFRDGRSLLGRLVTRLLLPGLRRYRLGYIPPHVFVPSLTRELLVLAEDTSIFARPYEDLNGHLVEMHYRRGVDIEHYPLPAALPPSFQRERDFPAAHIYRLRRVRIGVWSGVCLIERKVLMESYGDALKLFGWANPLPALVGTRATKLSEEGLITCLPWAGYYHFVLEELPRLLAVLHAYPDAKVVIPPDTPAYALGALEHLRAVERLRWEPLVVQAKLLAVPDYVFASSPRDSGYVHRDDVAAVRELMSEPHLRNEELPTRVYISRREVSRRSFSNEGEVEDALAELGIVTVYLEESPWLEQMALFRNVELVVGAHGAGLANLVWCERAPQVVELFPAQFVHDCYAQLACQVGAHYHALWARPGGEWGRMDTDELRHCLEALQSTPPADLGAGQA